MTLAGSGQNVTQKFTVTGGLTQFTSSCEGCSANFVVELLNSDGQEVDLLVNTIGGYSGAAAEGLDPGSYVLDVTADASWTVVVTQPRGVSAASLPQTYTGRSDQVVGPFQAGDAMKIQASNTGNGNFVVKVVSASGDNADLAFNEIGNFTGSTIAQANLTSAPFYLVVTSDGSWTLTVSNP